MEIENFLPHCSQIESISFVFGLFSFTVLVAIIAIQRLVKRDGGIPVETETRIKTKKKNSDSVFVSSGELTIAMFITVAIMAGPMVLKHFYGINFCNSNEKANSPSENINSSPQIQKKSIEEVCKSFEGETYKFGDVRNLRVVYREVD